MQGLSGEVVGWGLTPSRNSMQEGDPEAGEHRWEIGDDEEDEEDFGPWVDQSPHPSPAVQGKVAEAALAAEHDEHEHEHEQEEREQELAASVASPGAAGAPPEASLNGTADARVTSTGSFHTGRGEPLCGAVGCNGAEGRHGDGEAAARAADTGGSCTREVEAGSAGGIEACGVSVGAGCVEGECGDGARGSEGLSGADGIDPGVEGVDGEGHVAADDADAGGSGGGGRRGEMVGTGDAPWSTATGAPCAVGGAPSRLGRDALAFGEEDDVAGHGVEGSLAPAPVWGMAAATATPSVVNGAAGEEGLGDAEGCCPQQGMWGAHGDSVVDDEGAEGAEGAEGPNGRDRTAGQGRGGSRRAAEVSMSSLEQELRRRGSIVKISPVEGWIYCGFAGDDAAGGAADSAVRPRLHDGGASGSLHGVQGQGGEAAGAGGAVAAWRSLAGDEPRALPPGR